MQVWLVDGNAEETDPEAANTPFLLTPAVSRIEPGRGQNVRIRRIGGGLPEDRESLFWFNVLEVPPSPNPNMFEANESLVQFSSRARSKFFYRPPGLRGNPDQAHRSLGFSLGSRQADNKIHLRVKNPSPYHITFDSLALQSGSGNSVLAEMNWTVVERMVAPMSELTIPLDVVAASGQSSFSGARVDYSIINDYGAKVAGQGSFN